MELSNTALRYNLRQVITDCLDEVEGWNTGAEDAHYMACGAALKYVEKYGNLDGARSDVLAAIEALVTLVETERKARPVLHPSIRVIRIYRDDDMHEGQEYVAVVNNQRCYECAILTVMIPEWKHATVRLMRPIETPHLGLLDNTVGALGGWHYLLNTADIDELQNTAVIME